MKRLFFILMLAAICGTLPGQEIPQEDVNQYGQKVSVEPLNAQMHDGILVLKGTKTDYRLWFDIRILTDAAVFFGAPDYCADQLDGKDNPNHIGNGINIRRSRFAVKAMLDKNWYGELDTDWTSGIPNQGCVPRILGLPDLP